MSWISNNPKIVQILLLLLLLETMCWDNVDLGGKAMMMGTVRPVLREVWFVVSVKAVLCLA